jgi:hypothetical protein
VAKQFVLNITTLFPFVEIFNDVTHQVARKRTWNFEADLCLPEGQFTWQ